eukprot:13835613-Alexandrium_andersonii.AAC.1
MAVVSMVRPNSPTMGTVENLLGAKAERQCYRRAASIPSNYAAFSLVEAYAAAAYACTTKEEI